MCISGLDVYNLALTGGVSKTVNTIATDSDHVPCVVEWPDVAKTLPRRMDGSWTDVGGGQPIVVQSSQMNER